MNNQPLTPEKVKLNDVEPEGFCNEPFILSREVKALRLDLNAMREALLKLVEVLQTPSKEAA
ncbi:MAG: hypothetical protein WBQ68_06220 [Terriglobales bacterium]